MAAPLLSRPPHRAGAGQRCDAGRIQSHCVRSAEVRWPLRHRRPSAAAGEGTNTAQSLHRIALASVRQEVETADASSSAARPASSRRTPTLTRTRFSILDQGRDRSLRISIQEAVTALARASRAAVAEGISPRSISQPAIDRGSSPARRRRRGLRFGFRGSRRPTAVGRREVAERARRARLPSRRRRHATSRASPCSRDR